jgi:hypothetical protein
MEAFLLGKLVDRWRRNESISVFVRDQAVKHKGWNQAELFDKNHIAISWKHLHNELRWIAAQEKGNIREPKMHLFV